MSLGATLGQQAPGTYTQDQILSDVVKTSYGLDASATPNDVFEKLADAVLSTGETAGGAQGSFSRFMYGNYAGNKEPSDATPQTIVLGFQPKVVFITRNFGYFPITSSNNRLNYYCGCTIEGPQSDTNNCIKIISTGFVVANTTNSYGARLNSLDINYVYFVLY